MKKLMLMLILLMISSFQVKAQTIVVTQKGDELLMIRMEEENQVMKLNEGHTFIKPLIDLKGEFVAYQDQTNEMYVSTLKSDSQVVFKESNINSYAWDGDRFIYSKIDGGIYQYDPLNQEKSILLEPNGFYYGGLTPNHQGHLFAQKTPIPATDSYDEPIGIIDYEFETKSETLIVPDSPQSKLGDPSGRIPVIAALSIDGNLLYVWSKPHSASMSADGVPLGIYNSETRRFKQIKTDQVTLLTYPDQLAVSPTNNHLIALVNGSGRIMNENKQIGILNIENQSFGIITKPNIVGMTPAFTKDGTRLLYSAGPEFKDDYRPFAMGVNHIYEYNFQTNEESQLTQGTEGFDFYPQDIGNKELLFLRILKGENLTLVKRNCDGVESTIVEHLPLEDYSYYGHFDGSQVMTIHSDDN